MTRNPIDLLELALAELVIRAKDPKDALKRIAGFQIEISNARANGCEGGDCSCEGDDCLAKGWEAFAPQPPQTKQPAQSKPDGGGCCCGECELWRAALAGSPRSPLADDVCLGGCCCGECELPLSSDDVVLGGCCCGEGDECLARGWEEFVPPLKPQSEQTAQQQPKKSIP